MTANFPRPGDQGQQGSCVGWAVAYGLKSFHARKRGTTDVFSPAYVFNQITQSAACQGAQFTDALNLITREGAATMAAFPYDPMSCAARPNATVKAGASAWRSEFWRRVNQSDATEIKAQLAAGFPVLIGMMVDDAFMALRGPAVYSAPGGMTRGGHAMVLLGYDDARSAFRVLNSWGARWGDQGYGWIGYQAFTAAVREAYVVKDQDGPAPSPSPTPTPTPTPQPPTTVPALDPVTLPAPQVQVSPVNGVPAVVVRVSGHLRNAQNHNAQLVVRFGVQTPSGPQGIPANPGSGFRDFAGILATGSPLTPITINDVDMSQGTVAIPLNEFRYGGTILVRALVFLDNFQIGQSDLASVNIAVPIAPQPTLGQFCCDGFGQRRCTINPSVLGTQCFCYGQGLGQTCQ